MEAITPYLTYIYIALAVIALLIILAMVSRAFKSRVRGRKGKRLGVSEYREIDQTRRLMLVRRDNVEHLILVGGGQSLVIEQNIALEDENEYASPPIARPQPTPQLIEEEEIEYEQEPEPNHHPAPRAPVFGDRAPNVRPIHREEPRLGRPDDGY
jgi:Meckel syndrome type 1 protein